LRIIIYSSQKSSLERSPYSRYLLEDHNLQQSECHFSNVLHTVGTILRIIIYSSQMSSLERSPYSRYLLEDHNLQQSECRLSNVLHTVGTFLRIIIYSIHNVVSLTFSIL
jgi:hypothetical protein